MEWTPPVRVPIGAGLWRTDPETCLYERKVYRAKASAESLIDRGVDRFAYVYDFATTGFTTSSSRAVRDCEADVTIPHS